jgi:hypothetical protein
VITLRTPLIVALATTLVGCSHQPLHQVAAESCPGKQTATDRPIKSFKANLPAKETKLTIAAKTERPPSYRARHRSHLVTKRAKPTSTAAKTEPPATRIPFPPHSPVVGPAPISNARSIQEQVAAATAVAERITGATGAAARDSAEPSAGASPNNAEPLVAIVLVRPEIRSVSDLAGKNIAIDDRYLVSSADVRNAIAAAGGLLVQLSAGKTTAIDRLVNGEVPAAVVALVSAVAAEGFPEIAGFRTFHVPLR